jgi:hypothetical protein
MDTIESYRNIIQSLLTAYAAIPIANGAIDCYTVNVGWDGYRRVYGCVLHLDIMNGKIWIQQNMTEMRVAQELVDLGVAKEDIVLGFQAPEMREYTGYAVA